MNSVSFDTTEAIPISLDDREVIDNSTNNPDIFRVAVSSVISPVETVKGYRPLLMYLENKLGKRVELIQRRTYQEVNDLLESGVIDLGFICTLSYVEAERKFGAQLLAIPQVNGYTHYRSITIVREESDMYGLEDIEGKRFAFTDPMSFSGRAAMIGELARIDRTPEDMFSSIIYTYSHDNSLRAVYDGLVDAACIDSIVFDYTAFLYPNITDDLRIIHESPSVGNPPAVIGPDATEEEFNLILEILLEMHNSVDGRNALDALMFDKFVQADNSAYNYIRNLIDTVQVDYDVE
ncbi:substrate-binding domain-containing protein [Desulfuribacillus alkaliarsenatis]|uniref:Phosphonate ABC transporter substrate-binding protein n=1 Tax=Desulfuribacillus alkaliarsenatis TaxID=766136 RepID=A0A1E5G0P0_9FIRM|nr:phosphate/phosphite/phosphonate ABC transporter substrate-binding protein [Desulfuribacillus alkaliarsenatis]OEF96473.1 hypothetical protein BHF68_07390 [Desulfuribacillus alkaliarsenatis]